MKDYGCPYMSSKKRIHSPNELPNKCTTLSHWLFVKYDMSYKAYQHKSKARKKALRAEFEEDTYDFRSTYNTDKTEIYLYSKQTDALKKSKMVLYL